MAEFPIGFTLSFSIVCLKPRCPEVDLSEIKILHWPECEKSEGERTSLKRKGFTSTRLASSEGQSGDPTPRRDALKCVALRFTGAL